MFCATVAYPVQQGGTFDFDYFANKHVPLFAHLLGDNCVRFEVHQPLASPGTPEPMFLAMAYFWVTSGEAFGATLGQYSQEIYGDIPHFTNIEPIRQWSRVM